jgi:hypothetical protein
MKSLILITDILQQHQIVLIVLVVWNVLMTMAFIAVAMWAGEKNRRASYPKPLAPVNLFRSTTTTPINSKQP